MESPSHLLQGIFLTQGSNPSLLLCRQILYHLSHQGSSAAVHGVTKGWTQFGNWKATTLFPVVMCGCESWTIKKDECWRIDGFELWCWRRLLRVSWAARRSNQSILKEISPEYSLEGLILKLKLQYSGYLMWSVDSLENILMLGKIEGRKRRGWQRVKWFDSITESMIMNLSKFRETLEGRGAWHTTVPWDDKELDTATEQQKFLYTVLLSLTLQYPVLSPFPKVTWVSSFLLHSLCCSFIVHLNSFFTDFFLSWIPSISCFT